MRIVFDLETDGLLYEGTKVHCGTTKDLDRPEDDLLHWEPHEIEDLFDYLYNANLLIGHNICAFDIPFIALKYPAKGKFSLEKCRDTYIISKMLYPERVGRHSLEYWGEKLGIPKVEHHEWTQYSPEMRGRNIQDVLLNIKLYEYLVSKLRGWPWLFSLMIENYMHYYQALQEQEGVDVDVELAEKIRGEIDAELETIDAKLYSELPMQVVHKWAEVKRPFKKDGDLTKGVKEWFNEVC